jgi:hypothetical protein
MKNLLKTSALVAALALSANAAHATAFSATETITVNAIAADAIVLTPASSTITYDNLVIGSTLADTVVSVTLSYDPDLSPLCSTPSTLALEEGGITKISFAITYAEGFCNSSGGGNMTLSMNEASVPAFSGTLTSSFDLYVGYAQTEVSATTS